MNVWIQLLSAGALTALVALVHGLGILRIRSTFGLQNDKLEQSSFDHRTLMLMAAMVICLFILHLIHVFVFAGFYMYVGAIRTLEEAMFYSMSSYATLGYTQDIPENWRLLGASQGLVGFLMLGWSTAFLVTKFDKMRA